MKFPSYSAPAARHAFQTLPRLSMDDYVVWLTESMAQADPAKVARQQALETTDIVPFRLVPATPKPLV